MIDDEETRIENYIYVINLAVVVRRSFNVYLYQKIVNYARS